MWGRNEGEREIAGSTFPFWDARSSTRTGVRSVLLHIDNVLILYYFSIALITSSLYNHVRIFPGCATGRRDRNHTTEAHMSGGNVVRWQCPNRECEWSLVATVMADEKDAPRCLCGSQMKKKTGTQGFRYLDFLREGMATEEEAGIEKE